MTEKYAFIESEEGNYPIVGMCRWSNVSRSGYYDWKQRGQSTSAARRDILSAQVQHAFEHSDGTYGYRRVHAQLARWGTDADPETIRSIMRELGLVACQPRPFRPVTTIAGDAHALPDLLRGDFDADRPGVKLVGDITYIRTAEGWLYLATVLDCFSKKVVGYAMAEHMRTTLVVDALKRAASNVSRRRSCHRSQSPDGSVAAGGANAPPAAASRTTAEWVNPRRGRDGACGHARIAQFRRQLAPFVTGHAAGRSAIDLVSIIEEPVHDRSVVQKAPGGIRERQVRLANQVLIP